MQATLAKMSPAALGNVMGDSSTFRKGIQQSGAFRVETVRAVSATEALTTALQKQDVTFSQAIKNRHRFNDVLKEQYKLQRMTAIGWTEDARGRMRADLIVPRGAPERLNSLTQSFAEAKRGNISFGTAVDDLRMKVGLMSSVMTSASHNLINWGKNTQWAGRQLMVGMTIPFMAFGAAAGMAAFTVDKEMTRVVKVYDAAGSQMIKTDEQLRATSMETAKAISQAYGQSATDTLKIMGDLASAGTKDVDLQETTRAVSRARFLGELDLQDALKATITLQTVYGQSAEKLTDTFNMMNAVENNTVLTMQDFVVLLPKIGGLIRELGGDAGDVAILGAAMKAAGIDAAEGANALKSISFRAVAANGKALETFKKATGEDLGTIVETANAEVIPTLTAMMKALEGLSKTQKVAVVRDVFGIYQGSKALSLMQQLAGESGEVSEQVARATEVVGQAPGDWAAASEREIDKFQKSVSGRFKSALESVKTELADIGQPFLEVATGILNVLGGVLRRFNELPEGAKKFVLITAAIIALVGPAIMITGIMANFFGQIMKGVAIMGTFLTRFKLMTPEMRAQQLLANQTALGWRDEAAAAAILSRQIQLLTGNIQRLTLAQSSSQAAGLTGFGNPTGFIGPIGAPLTKDAAGRYQRQGGGFASKGEINAHESAQRSSAAIASNSVKTEGRWASIANHMAGVGIAAAFFGSMVTDSGTLMNTMMNVLMVASLIGPTVGKAMSAIGTKLGGSLSGGGGAIMRPLNAAKAGVTSLGSKIAQLGPMLLKWGGAFGIVAAGVAFSVMQINKQVDATAEKTKRAAESAKDWGEALGYTYVDAGQKISKTGEVVDTLDAKIKKFRESNKAAADELSGFRGESEDVQWARAVEEGLRVRLHGGSVKAAEEATRAALSIMGKRFSEEEFKIRLTPEIDFANMDRVMNVQLKNIDKRISAASRNAFSQGNWESLGRWFTGEEDLNTKSAETIRASAREMWNIYSQASVKEQQFVFDKIEQTATEDIEKTFDDINSKYDNILKSRGINNVADLMKLTKGGKVNVLPVEIGEEDQKRLMQHLQTLRLILEEWGKENAMDDKSLANLHSFSQLEKELRVGQDLAKGATMSLVDANREYGNTLMSLLTSGRQLSEEEKLRILNSYRLKAGLDAATHSEQGFGNAVRSSTSALAAGANAMDVMQATTEDWIAARQSVMSSTMNSALEFADTIMQSQHQSALDNISARGDAKLKALEAQGDAMDDRLDNKRKAFEKRWDATMRNFDNKWDARKEREKLYYDNRIEGINRAIEAERNAEEQRQKNFDAEQRRIERLSEMFSKNVDLNMALNSGNLDEAAKIANDMQSKTEAWGLEDVAEGSQTASDKKIAGFEAQIQKLEAQRDARLKMLDEIEEREKLMLEAKKQREAEALEAERKRYQRAAEAAREKIQEQTRMEQEAARKRYEANKRALDMELATLRAFIPRNEAEMRAHMARISGAYAKYGVNLKGQGNQWGQYVGNSLQANVNRAAMEMRSKIAWAQLASDIANNMSKGAFGLTLGQFMEWVKTGNLPANAKPVAPTGQPKQDRWYSSSGAVQNRHAGGAVGMGGVNNRTGYPMGAGTFPSEVDTRLQVGEWVMNKKAVNFYGAGLMDAINNRSIAMDSTGKGGVGGPELGLSGLMVGMGISMMKKAIAQQMANAGAKAMAQSALAGMFGTGIAGKPGRYGNVDLNASQLGNAARIIGVGRSMGATNRDLVISIMTAMQESTLRNLAGGDRDSVGLFQQRPSQGWGTVAQIMNPEYAARKFFEKELRVPNRHNMAPTLVAQAVQRSAFPYAYAKWQQMAEAVVKGTGFMTGGGGGMLPGGPGFIRPMRGGRVSSEWGYRTDPFTGARSYHDGIDIAAPGGTPIYASQSGVVSQAAWDGGYGNRTILNHSNGLQTGYAHQSRMLVRPGQSIRQGQLIGHVGTTGRSSGNHLHFQVGRKYAWQNPRSYVPGLAKGGFTLNDGLANLHRNETVLTEPLTDKFKQGVDNFASGVNNEYNVTVDLRGAMVSEELDLQAAIQRGIRAAEREKENRRGFNRRVNP
jgi:TP901 family phage tail tape measure protein